MLVSLESFIRKQKNKGSEGKVILEKNTGTSGNFTLYLTLFSFWLFVNRFFATL